MFSISFMSRQNDFSPWDRFIVLPGPFLSAGSVYRLPRTRSLNGMSLSSSQDAELWQIPIQTYLLKHPSKVIWEALNSPESLSE